MILQPIEDGAFIVYFNGPSELHEISLQTEKIEKFALQLSDNGVDFESYDDEEGEPAVRLFN